MLPGTKWLWAEYPKPLSYLPSYQSSTGKISKTVFGLAEMADQQEIKYCVFFSHIPLWSKFISDWYSFCLAAFLIHERKPNQVCGEKGWIDCIEIRVCCSPVLEIIRLLFLFCVCKILLRSRLPSFLLGGLNKDVQLCAGTWG